MHYDLVFLPLKGIKKIYSHFSGNGFDKRVWKMVSCKEYASDMIYTSLLSDKPLMIARLGATELSVMVNYLGVKRPNEFGSLKGYIKGKSALRWWDPSIVKHMCMCSGFFPISIKKLEQFCELMIKDLPCVDILGSWLEYESFFEKELSASKKVMLYDIEPFFSSRPWTWALEGKRVLIIHPFIETIKSQYERREKLFDNNVLPTFSLETIKAVQSIAFQKTKFEDWFDALETMKEEIYQKNFDICILGCGAYGFPLAAHIKRLGKKAIHLGGVTQLLFGIIGSRWEKFTVYPYFNLFNKYWVRPNQNETPENASRIEGKCYW